MLWTVMKFRIRREGDEVVKLKSWWSGLAKAVSGLTVQGKGRDHNPSRHMDTSPSRSDHCLYQLYHIWRALSYHSLK